MTEKEKKITEDKSEKVKSKSTTHLVLIALLVIGVSIFLVSIIASESKKFEYIGLTFDKQDFGEIPIFSAHIVGNSVNVDPINFRANFRNDPRTNNIPVEKNIVIVPNSPVFVSLNMSSNIYECGSIALLTFGQFMQSMRYETETGITTKDKAEEFDKPHINCDNASGSTVIVISAGNETSIKVNDKNLDCYEIMINSNTCTEDNNDLTKAIEKAELSILSEMTKKPL